jgi:hypothetical protein
VGHIADSVSFYDTVERPISVYPDTVSSLLVCINTRIFPIYKIAKEAKVWSIVQLHYVRGSRPQYVTRRPTPNATILHKAMRGLIRIHGSSIIGRANNKIPDMDAAYPT